MAWSIFTNGGGPQVAVGWAQQFLKRIGAPVTPGNVEFVYQWEKSEGGGGKYNPLNQGPVQGHPELTTTGEQFGGGAADYASWDAGLQGAYYFLHYNFYKGVLQNLQANNPAAARAALWASPWAASHYGYGKNWYFGTIPGGTPILPGSAEAMAGSGGGNTTATDVSATAPPTCAWNLAAPSLSTPNSIGPLPLPNVTIGGQSFCVLSKTQVRVGLSLLLLGGAVAVGMLGVIVLVAYGLKQTGAQEKLTQVAAFVPGGGVVATAARASAAKTSSPRPARQSRTPSPERSRDLVGEQTARYA
jgi:hypothetical protein